MDEVFPESSTHFKWQDYVTLVTMLAIPSAIGFYFGITGASINMEEYLLGNRKMNSFPIIMSLIVSYFSGITFLGLPTDVYLYGNQCIYFLGSLLITAVIINYIYLPVLYNLKITSVYEYLTRRFDKRVGILTSVLYLIYTATWLSFLMYIPVIALNQVTSVNENFLTPLVCIVCILYTSLGGLKGVVWSDAFQAGIIFIAIVSVIVKGTIDIGGIGYLFEKNWESGRIEGPSFDFNPTTRYTFWSIIFGASFYFLHGYTNQNIVQRFFALPSLKCAKKSMWFSTAGYSLLLVSCTYCGFLIYATFYKCDPLTTKLAKEKDQLLPLLAMRVLGDYPGFTGIFIAGVLSASLSSLSTGLNGVSAVVLHNFYPLFFKKPLKEKHQQVMLKLVVIIFGVICVALVYVIKNMGSLIPVYMSLDAITAGPTLSLFIMGILLPWINAKGALVGGTTSLLVMSWLCFKAQTSGNMIYSKKPLSTEECRYNFTIQELPQNVTQIESEFHIYNISYLWYNTIGILVAIFVAFCISFLTRFESHLVDPILLAPCMRKYVDSRRTRQHLNDTPHKSEQDGLILNSSKKSSNANESQNHEDVN